MLSRLTFIVGWLLLGVALAAIPANASESRGSTFFVTCDGTNKHVEFNASGLGASTNRFIQGAEILALDTRGSLLYVVVKAQNDDKLLLLTTGPGKTHSRADLTSSLFRVLTDASGNAPIGADVVCSPGPPLGLLVIIYFFS